MSAPCDRIPRILEKLSLARLADPECEVFGADSHRYVVHPPASEEAIRRFELQHGIALPGAFRSFLLHVGNGGVGSHGSAAGPFYGVYPLGATMCATPADEPRPLLAKPCVLSPRMPKQDWAALIARSHPHAILFGGLLVIGSQGCRHDHCLVLNGPFAGRVVNVDEDMTTPPVFAHEPDFLAWYERWLDEVISGDLRQTQSWFGYARGGPEVQLLAGFEAGSEPLEKRECLEGLGYKRRLSEATLLDLVRLYPDSGEHRSAICQIVCKSDRALARPLLSDLSRREALPFFQCLHWYAREDIPEWEAPILAWAERIEELETFRFFTYILEALHVDRGAYLARLTGNPQAGIRSHALYALGKIKDRPRYLACFVEGLQDADSNVVRTALQALAGLEDPSLLPHYRQLVERFPVEEAYVLSNLDRRLAEFGLSRETLLDR